MASPGSPSTSSDTMTAIVQGLNQHLGLDLTLVKLDRKTGEQLSELLRQVCELLSPSLHVDFQKVPLPYRAADFAASVLGYNSGRERQAFRAGVVNGDRVVVYPLLSWIFEHFEKLKKKVYLAKYIMPVQVPADLLATDEEVGEAMETLKGLVMRFKIVHKDVERLRQSKLFPAELQRESQRLEEDKDQLVGNIERTRKKLQNLEEDEEGANEEDEQLVQAVSKLRQEQDRDRELAKQLKEQQDLLEEARMKHASVKKRLHDVESDARQFGINGLISRLDKELTSKQRIAQDLPREIQDAKQQLDRLSRVVYGNVNIGSLEEEVSQLREEVSGLEAKESTKSKSSREDKLRMYQQQALLVSNNKKQLEERLRAKEAELQALSSRSRDMNSRSFVQKIPQGEERKRFTAEIRNKTAKVQNLRKRLEGLDNEMAVLNRTEQLLERRCLKLRKELGTLESTYGISGYRDAQEELEKVSGSKREIDERNERLLQEYSEKVIEFQQKIKDREADLKPDVDALQELKKQVAEIEAEYEERKRMYENIRVGYETNIEEMQNRVNQMVEECHRQESNLHLVNSRRQIVAAQIRRVEHELDCKMGHATLSNEYQTREEKFQVRTKMLERRADELKEQKREIEANKIPNMRQMMMFTSLNKLLDCKLQSGGSGGLGEIMGAQEMDKGTSVGGVDRLVL